MPSLTPARRRAEEFDALVESTRTGGAGGSHAARRRADRHADLLPLVDALARTPRVDPRPEFSADLRERLMAEADTSMVPVTQKLSLRPDEDGVSVAPARPSRRFAVAIGTATLLGATTSVGYAAQGAMPGDALYPIKRGLESVSTGLTTSDATRADRVMAHATDRLAEAQSLSEQGGASADRNVPGTVDDFTGLAQEAGDLSLSAYREDADRAQVEQLRGFISASMDQLALIDTIGPDSAHDELVAAADALAELDRRALAACGDCEGEVLDTPPFVLSSKDVRPRAGRDAAPRADRYQPDLPDLGEEFHLPPANLDPPQTDRDPRAPGGPLPLGPGDRDPRTPDPGTPDPGDPTPDDPGGLLPDDPDGPLPLDPKNPLPDGGGPHRIDDGLLDDDGIIERDGPLGPGGLLGNLLDGNLLNNKKQGGGTQNGGLGDLNPLD